MSCTCTAIIKKHTPGVEFIGMQWHGSYARIEIQCNRLDEHPLNGSEHWWEHGGLRLTWTVPSDGVWMAGGGDSSENSQLPKTTARIPMPAVKDPRPLGCLCREWIGDAMKIESYCPVHGRASIPSFHREAYWLELAGRGWIAAVCLDRDLDEEGMRELARSLVMIDGKTYQCKGVERFAHSSPWRAGEHIGLLVEGDSEGPRVVA